eukprot:TRINITY_DN32487_c0_g1_i1.p1 TRINITY_DN32487_c0_g1~~TRINITY_DN32487_c0_g1_i1.p1  ORF type:complete len:178 (-),score=25.48 TRINITY_DN32487_c0_g1_i1:229-762(-)
MEERGGRRQRQEETLRSGEPRKSSKVSKNSTPLSAATSFVPPSHAPPPSHTPPGAPVARDEDLILPAVLPFKRSQLSERKGQHTSKKGHWKHLKQILQIENAQSLPPDEPTYTSIEAPPSMYPSRKYCDITGFEAPYSDPYTKLRYANADAFALARSLPPETVQGFLSLRKAQTVLK